MANRIVGNVYVIDSQTGAASALTVGTAAWLDNMCVSAFAFWASDTTGAFELVFASATDTSAFKAGHAQNVSDTTWSSFGEAVYFKELRCKTLTSGTGYIYFK